MAKGDDEITVQASRSVFPTASLPVYIGAYRIVRKIGEGGQGVVYEAEQQSPRRSVALKVIRGGRMVPEDHVKLFQRESQVLARLKDPRIATIYEAGMTEDGQHFFAMELVHGVPLSVYREQAIREKESLSTLLRLFQKVCDAVSYAHQKGVIHRDLKPTNILVTGVADPRGSGPPRVPEIKVLDFGLARVTDADASTIVTLAGTLQGTLAYMSPEQVRANPDEIDLRSDVYSLGVVLYQLIAGRPPYILADKTPFDITRVICEVPPASLRVEAGARVDRDLETIVFKALEKEPARRYQSASALAEDLERYLNDEPILARPPSAPYQIQKLISRNKAAFAFAATLVSLLAVFAVAMALQSRRIAIERDKAFEAERFAAREAETAKEVSRFLVDLFAVSDPSESAGSRITARELLDRGSERIHRELQAQPVVQARLMNVMGEAYRSLGIYDRSEPLLTAALDTRRRELGNEHLEVAESLDSLSILAHARGDFRKAEELARESLAMRRKLQGTEHVDVTEAMNSLAITLRRRESPEANAEAEALYRDALAIRRKLLGSEHELIAENIVNLGVLLYANRRDYAQAESLFREALAMNVKLRGEQHPEVAINLNNLALVLRDQGRYDEAEALFRRALVMDREMLGNRHPTVAVVLNNLANVFQRRGDWEGAEPLYREALDHKREIFGDGHWETATVASLLGGCLAALKRYPEAEPLLLESYPVIRASFGSSHPRTQVSLRRIVELYDAWGRPDSAARYRRDLVPP